MYMSLVIEVSGPDTLEQEVYPLQTTCHLLYSIDRCAGQL